MVERPRQAWARPERIGQPRTSRAPASLRSHYYSELFQVLWAYPTSTGKPDRTGDGLKLEGQVAIVTGAGSKASGLGTGKAMAVLFAREGARVVLVDRHEDRANETLRWIEDEGGTATTVVLDISEPSASQQIVDETVAQYGRIDIVVNNAAVFAPGLLETSPERYQEVIGTNLTAPFMLSKAAIPVMVEGGGGSILFITSILAMRGGGAPAYAASKAGLMGLTTSLANSFGRQGVRVNCIAPGIIDTPMRAASMANSGIDPKDIDMSNSTSLGIEGDAWDVARAALFLASSDGRYITGLLLPVDGGTTTRLG